MSICTGTKSSKGQPIKINNRFFRFQPNLHFSSDSELVKCEAVHLTVADMLSFLVLSLHNTGDSKP